MSDNVGNGDDDGVEDDDDAATAVESPDVELVPGTALTRPIAAFAPSAAIAKLLPPPEGAYSQDSYQAVLKYIEHRLSPRSKHNALDALRRLARVIFRDDSAHPAQFPWPRLTYEQAAVIRVTLYEQSRSGTITPGTANLTLSHLRGLMHTMYGMDLITPRQHEFTHSGVLKNVPGSREPRGRAISPREERALREAARALDGYRGAMLDTAIVLATGAGLRREEVARLAVEGLAPGLLSVIGKGNKARRIPIDRQMQAAADAWLDERAQIAPTHGGLFCSPQRPEWVLSPWSFWALVRSAAHIAFGDRQPCTRECVCLKVVTGPHDFRRTFATRLLDQGLDIGEVQRLMGHESPETTARYDKRDIEALFEKRRKMRVIA